MENVNPFVSAPPNGLRTYVSQELFELCPISAIIDSRHENFDHTQVITPPLYDDFMNLPDVFEMDDLELDNESADTPLVSLFIDSDDESNNGKVLNELNKYGNAGKLYNYRVINCRDGCDLAFPCMIVVEGLETPGKNLVAIIRNVYVFVGSFTYVEDFVVLEDIGDLIEHGPDYQVDDDMKEWLIRGHVKSEYQLWGRGNPKAGTADNTDHTMAEHNQVGCRLPVVEHCIPQPYAQTLPSTCPDDMTAYTPSSL
ncbi:hypothetical protein Tco_0761688 [Tanacetum coccineum]